MRLSKFKRFIFLLILFIILLSIPFFSDIYYISFYYLGSICLITFSIYRIAWEEKKDKQFLKRWHNARKQGFKLNVFRESTKAFVLMTLSIIIIQFIVYGRTPVDIISKVSINLLIILLIILSMFSLIIGIVTWYENNKKYNRLYNKG
ncbi:MAG: hypothetical protein FH751_16405 [Firmicutes bacterium]|nr:hypothetical protein [Bacillota bacterium]